MPSGVASGKDFLSGLLVADLSLYPHVTFHLYMQGEYTLDVLLFL